MIEDTIIDYLKKDKKLRHKYSVLDYKLEKAKEEIKEFEAKFNEEAIGIKVYRDFFKKYYFDCKDGMYIVKLIAYNNGAYKFFEVIYDYISKKDSNENSYDAHLSLRKMLHIYATGNFKIKKRKDEK